MNYYDRLGNKLPYVFDRKGNKIDDGLNFDDLTRVPYLENTIDDSKVMFNYMGGNIEIQPDSWDGTIVNGDIVSSSDSTAWGFPISLNNDSKASIHDEILKGDEYGIRYIRFPLGFGYRGYRNIDSVTNLAKNIGERFPNQNKSLKDLFTDISLAGGGLNVEYWCLAPYWCTSSAYYDGNVNNLWAGGSYARNVTLDSIRDTDKTQYNAQINQITNAIINDLEYLHTNIAPVRLFGLAGEPSNSVAKYGKMGYVSSQEYNDVLEVLYPKIQNSTVLGSYNGKSNQVLLHVASSNEKPPFDGLASIFIQNHANWIWGYSHDAYITRINGETTAEASAFINSDSYKNAVVGNRENVFICEYEYFSENVGDNRRCGNNMQRMLQEMNIGKARIVHPIIHICKPTGQTLSDTNTRGYCMYSVNMNDGSIQTNDWAYRSWKFINDNLPIGAEIIQCNQHNYVGLVIAKYKGKYIVLSALGYEGYQSAQVVLHFDREVTFEGKAYSMQYLGDKVQAKKGTKIDFKVPACTGIVWHEL